MAEELIYAKTITTTDVMNGFDFFSKHTQLLTSKSIKLLY